MLDKVKELSSKVDEYNWYNHYGEQYLRCLKEQD